MIRGQSILLILALAAPSQAAAETNTSLKPVGWASA